MDVRWVVYVIWGLGTTLVWAAALAGAYGGWRLYRDRRARRELLSTTGLFLTALGSSLAILLALFGEQGSALRQFVLAFALGMFTGAGIVLVSNRRDVA